MAVRQPFQSLDANTQPAPQPTTKSSKKRKSDSDHTDGSKTKSSKKDSDLPDLSEIHLPGDANSTVQVWETPAEVRKKVNAYLRNTNVTQTGLARALTQQYHDYRDVKQHHVRRFLAGKGVDGMCESPAFYAAYVFFEKLRIKDNKPKSKFRQEMENIWSKEGGYPAGEPGLTGRRLWCMQGERITYDKYGQVKITGPNGRVNTIMPRNN